MLGGQSNVGFDWSNITVSKADEWRSGATGTKRVTLYAGNPLTIRNYNPVATRHTDGDFEYGLLTDVANPGASVTANRIYFDVNKFQNGNVATTTSGTGDLYGGTSTLGNTTNHNTVTLSHTWVGNIYGGYTQSTTGDSNYNTLVLNPNGNNGNRYMYAGWSNQGNATHNTVVLNTGAPTLGATEIYGGFSNNSSADVITGNTLKVTSKSNSTTFNNFEKLEFELNSGIASGDTMLGGQSNVGFDWSNIKVTGLRAWANALAAHNVNTPTLTLYSGANLTLNNYAPTIVGTRGDYEFGKRANTAGTGTVSASILSVDGNRFQNAGHGVNVTTPGATPRDTYAGLSIYGNTTNHNELNITGGSHPNARAGYTDAQSGGSDFNTLNLTGGNVTNGYAGYTTGVHLLANPEDENHPELVDTTKNADAKNNTVNINGGTLNAGGKLYGGYIAPNAALTPPNNVSAGDAKGNTINIENGTFGGSTEIYGGYTNGTGKATGNTVNLGKSDGTFSASTLNNTFIYGGASSGSAADVMTDNTLNVNTQNITARGVTNFGKTVFNLNSTTVVSSPTPNTLLTIGGGATTGLDWAGVEVNPGSTTFTPSTYEKHLFKAMHNGSGITFSNYAPYGAKEKIVGNLEYIIDTDNHTGTAGQDVYIDGFQFKDHTSAAYSETTSHPEAWAGRTASGQTVTNNKLAFTGNAVNAYGGLVENKKHNSDGTYKTTGDAKKNTLEVTGGTLTNAYGAKVTPKGGSAEENTIKITGGSISGSAYVQRFRMRQARAQGPRTKPK